MPTIAIIGANRGLGLELVRQYAADGWTAHVTARDPARAVELRGVSGDVHVHALDVADEAGTQGFADRMTQEGLDVVIHNAGVYSTDPADQDWLMRINADAPMRLAEALLPALKTAGERKLVLVSSREGAREGAPTSSVPYALSKRELNDQFRAAWPRWQASGVRAIALHPGWVKTEMGGQSAEVTTEASARGIREVIAGLDDAKAGRFWTYAGVEHPW